MKRILLPLLTLSIGLNAASGLAATLSCTVREYGNPETKVFQKEMEESMATLELGRFLDQEVRALTISTQGPIAIQAVQPSGNVVSTSDETLAVLKLRNDRGTASTYECKIED